MALSLDLTLRIAPIRLNCCNCMRHLEAGERVFAGTQLYGDKSGWALDVGIILSCATCGPDVLGCDPPISEGTLDEQAVEALRGHSP